MRVMAKKTPTKKAAPQPEPAPQAEVANSGATGSLTVFDRLSQFLEHCRANDIELNEPEKSNFYGDRTPEFAVWLYLTDPDKFAVQYQCRTQPDEYPFGDEVVQRFAGRRTNALVGPPQYSDDEVLAFAESLR